MARIKSAWTQILGQLTAFLTALVKAVQEMGGDDEDLELLGNSEQSGELIGKIAALVVTESRLRRQRGNDDPIAEWARFYREVFDVEADLAGVTVPVDPGGFGWVVVVPQGMTTTRAWGVCKARFSSWSAYGDDLDVAVPTNDRTTARIYAVRFRDRVEADEELKNLSANLLAERGTKGITLMERLLLELWYHWRTGKHLDLQNVTLCSGSRSAYGVVPSVGWDESRLEVGWYSPGDASDYLRSREAVST